MNKALLFPPEELSDFSPLRQTRARRAILETLASGAGHPDAETLHQLARRLEPHLSVASVYRTLRELEVRGAVVRHIFAPGAACWELAGEEPHDHLVDIQSGEIIEFKSAELRQAEEAVAAMLGYQLAQVRLTMYGLRRAPGT